MINHLPDKLKNDIIEYCKLNNIDDITSFLIKLIRQSLTIEMYGRNPDILRIKEPEIVIEEEIKPVIPEPVVVDIPKEEPIIVEENLKNEYNIDLNLEKKSKPIEQKLPPTPIQNEDIYGEGKNGWFGGSNLYDLLKKRK